MPHFFKRAAAIRDLVEHYVYLEEQAGEGLAERFLANAESSFFALSEHPEMGAALTLRRPEFAALRAPEDVTPLPPPSSRVEYVEVAA